MELKRVVWAVDAFPDKPELQVQTANAVKALVEGSPALVEPVYVISAPPPGLIIQADPRVSEQLEMARLNLESLFARVPVPGLLPVCFAHTEGHAIAKAVEALLSHALSTGADLIAVGTHARRGMPRWFLGSFAETLLHQSPIPVVVANAKMPYVSMIRHILFATDFSEESREGYQDAIELARQRSSDILLFHHLEYLSPMLGHPFVVPTVSRESLKDLAASRQVKGAEWVALAGVRGVRAKLHISTTRGDPAKLIAKAAEKLPDSLIAMTSQSGPLGAILLGSITRWVVRVSKRPVLVLHPGGRREVRKQDKPRNRVGSVSLFS